MGLASGASPQASDGYGSGRLRLYSLGVDARKDCETCIQVVMNRVVSQQVSGEPRWNRSLVQFTIEKRNGAWGINFSLTGIQFNDEIRAKLGGGVLSGVTYRLWNPADGTKPAGPLGLWLGASVSVSRAGDCLNLRASATKSSRALACLKDGTKVNVVGGPIVADGIA